MNKQFTIVGYFKPATNTNTATISLTEPPGTSVGVISVLEAELKLEEALKEQKQRHIAACKDVFDAYWHRDKGGDQANRGLLASIAQECEERIKQSDKR